MADAAIAEPKATFAFLDGFANSWNRHDTAAILTAMTDDCVFETSFGPTVAGTATLGKRRPGAESRMSSSSSLTRCGTALGTSSREIVA